MNERMYLGWTGVLFFLAGSVLTLYKFAGLGSITDSSENLIPAIITNASH